MAPSRVGTDKRELVRRVAAKLFRDGGYHGTRMDEIAAGVGLDKGTLYHYFDGKSDILYDIFIESIEIAHGVLPELADAVPADLAIERFVRHQLHTVATRPNEAAVYFQESRYLSRWLSRPQVREIRRGEEAVAAQLVAVIERGIRDGSFAPVDPHVAAQGVVGICAWVSTWHRPSSGISLDEVGATYSSMVLGGLRHSSLMQSSAPPSQR